MHALRVAPGRAVAIGLLITTAAIGCSSNAAPSSTATSGQSTTPSAAAPTTSAAATSSDSPTSSNGVQNLAVSTAVRSELLAAFAAVKNIPVSDVAGSTPGSIYYGYVPSTQTYWAMGSYEPASTDSLTVKVSFQDGGETGLFKKVGSAPWQAGTGGVPPFCAEISFFPQAVLEAWSLPTTPPPSSKC
jgi:hypothetical protein